MLTGNDTALAQSAVQLAIAWHKKNPTSDFGQTEIAKLDDLNKKLSRILDETNLDDIEGDEIMLVPSQVAAASQ